jgi:hypothetical protein
MGEARAGNPANGTGARGIDWATVKLIEAQIVGIDAETEISNPKRDPLGPDGPGGHSRIKVPAGKPLPLEVAPASSA